MNEFIKKQFNEWKNYLRKYFQADADENTIEPTANEEDYIKDSKTALLSQKTPIAHVILICILVFLILGLFWSYFATIEQVTIGQGRVIASSKDKIIQSLDGGIVAEIYVQEGEIVKPNQKLIRLDDTRYKSDYNASYTKYLALLAAVARLTAEEKGAPTITFPAELNNYPEVTDTEIRLFNTRRTNLTNEINALQKSYEDALGQTKMYEQLLPKGYVSRLEYLRSQQNAHDLQTKIIQRKNQFTEEVSQDLTKNRTDLESLQKDLSSLHDKMIRTTLYSPVYGIVKKINVVTVGGVISPGEHIMEIVPLSDKLMIEAYINPSHIAFVHVGQHANIKVTAYDFSIYGSLTGTVEYISANTISKDKTNESLIPSDQDDFYVVKIRVDKNYLGNEKHKLYILPGMVVTAHIKTDKKTILQYLLKPLIKAKEEALRER